MAEIMDLTPPPAPAPPQTARPAPTGWIHPWLVVEVTPEQARLLEARMRLGGVR